MPELGETWSATEMDGRGSNRTEAVLIATGPTMVRLVTRTGRRITLPTRSLDLIWSRVQGPPTEPRPCLSCRQAAFFRHTVGGDIVWVCEDHLPHGAMAYFPGDTPGPAGLEIACPSCESTQVTTEPSLLPLPRDRATTRMTCARCQCRWSPLIARGLGDDGTVLMGDLHQMIEGDSSISEIWVGFVAYRNLCRAIGMGDLGHVHGVPIRSHSTLADALTLVFSNPRGNLEDTEALAGVSVPRFGVRFPEFDVHPGSVWKRRAICAKREIFCSVRSVEGCQVTFEITGSQIEMTLDADGFLLYWAPHIRQTQCPANWTIWRHLETRQLVQVTTGTSTQILNGQVSYFTSDGRREATPIATFHRLYQELPAPPEGHIWCKGDELFEVDRVDDEVSVCPYGLHEEPLAQPRLVKIRTFYAEYDPLLLVDELEDEGLGFESSLRTGARWRNREDLSTTIVLDKGRVGAKSYVRFLVGAMLHIMEQASFLSGFEHFPVPLPYCIGETWVSLQDPSRSGVIVDTRVAPSGYLFIRWVDDDSVTLLSLQALTSQYRRLDVRSYWEILDEDEEG